MTSNNDKIWQVERSEPGPNLVLFQTRYDWVRNPRNARQMKAVVLEASDWVNVVAVRPDKKLVVVRQYRFGIGKVTTEIPAGLMNPGEEPQAAAARELLEETGYTSADWKYLGWVEANPAFMNNLCHQFLALDVTRTAEPELDEGEQIEVSALTLEEVRDEIEQGRMRNAIALLALSRVYDLRT